MNARIVDISNQRFGTLTAVELIGRVRRQALWRCRCDCGAVVDAAGMELRRGNQRSCGRTECRPVKHGYARSGTMRSPEYRSWASMLSRCTNPQAADYGRYGGRGIGVCERWRLSFEHFLEDMGPRPSGRSLDRFPDNDGNYEPGNCRWATLVEQARNKRNNRILEAEGERRTLAEWSERTGLHVTTILTRIRSGWSEARAVTTPLRHDHGNGKGSRQ